MELIVNYLKLDRRTAKHKINALTTELFDNHKIESFIQSNVSVFNAGTYSDDSMQPVYVKIGIYEIEHTKGLGFHKFNPIISDFLFANVVLNAYHEYFHCIQKNQLFRQPNLDESTKNQLVQDLACFDNPDYYVYDGNYRINASEIQAEWHGISGAYSYLCKEFPNIDSSLHEQLIVSVVNEKMQNSTYFVSQPSEFQSLQEIEDAFDEVYDASFTKQRLYFVEKRRTKDTVKQYMQTHPEAKEVYLSLQEPLERDRCVAAINLMLHPNLEVNYPALRSIDLSYGTVITKQYEKLHSVKTNEQVRIEELQTLLQKRAGPSTSDVHKQRVKSVEKMLSNLEVNEKRER